MVHLSDFSNSDGDVFIIRLQRMIDRGALMSRYSRTASLDIRDVYEKEFATNPDRGRDFYRKVFTEYGDESIAELVTAQIAMQNVSNIATKIIEEARIGLSYLEKSSRYVNYDVKRGGKYLFLPSEKAGFTGKLAGEYDELCNELFETYSALKGELEAELRARYPFESVFSNETGPSGDQDEKIMMKTYDRSLKSRVFDEIRNLLPSSTLTNLGISGNGRAFLGMIQRLRQYSAPEINHLAEAVYRELREELPELIDTADTDYSRRTVQYNRERDSRSELEGENDSIRLVNLISHDSEDSAMSAIFNARKYLDSTGRASTGNESGGGKNGFMEMLNHEIDIRKNRRHKLGRWFEFTHYTFEVNTNYGSFRDLQRHRMMTIIRKNVTPLFGFDVPPLLSEYEGLKAQYSSVMLKARELWKKLRASFGEEMAQYVVPYGYRYPVLIHANLREIAYFTELRSTPQAHYDLRMISQEMYRKIQVVQPELSRVMKFVDHDDYLFGRLKSEMRKEEKLKKLNSGQ